VFEETIRVTICRGRVQKSCTKLRAHATALRITDASKPASVPSKLTAPSVPCGTVDIVVTRYLVTEPRATVCN